ncbi:MAG: MFS transporter, partial [Flavobacteriaceae bacterium]|nr:MFS transporter [Flavobacteriaceae bacterium]
SVAGTYVGGYLTDRIGYYKVQFWSLLLTGLMFGVLMYMKTFLAFSICLFFLTFIADLFRPANFAAVRIYSKPVNRTRSISLIRLAINLGVGIGPAIGGLMAATYGYEWLFIGDGGTCILAAIFFRIALKEKKATPEEKETQKNLPKVSVWHDRYFRIFLGATFFMALAFLQILYTTSMAFNDLFGIGEAGIGLLFGINGFLIFLIEMPIVFVLETRYNTLKLIALGSFIIAGSYFVLVTPYGWIGLAFISILLITFGEIISFPFSSAFAVERAPEGMVGRFMGMYGMMFSIAHIIAPIIGMQMIRVFGYSALYYLLGTFCLISGWGYWHLAGLLKKDPQPVLITDNLVVPGN